MLHVTDWFLLSGIKGFLYLDPGSGSVLLQVIIARSSACSAIVRSMYQVRLLAN